MCIVDAYVYDCVFVDVYQYVLDYANVLVDVSVDVHQSDFSVYIIFCVCMNVHVSVFVGVI